MATVTSVAPARSRDESQRKVAHPLQRLRGRIRLYVAAEGLAVLLLYLAAWFWLGILVDYGFFKVFKIDWVQELPHGFRVTLLCALVTGLLSVIAYKVLFRLFREFRDPALALVLERRYPQLLGDRLITAVELADPKLVKSYGYSQAMIDQTIHEAGERVEQLSIEDVFDWGRLRRAGLMIFLVTIGLYMIVGGVYGVLAKAGASDFVWRFNDVAVIWAERNLLLQDTIWPRQAHLELLGFPGNEMKVGRDASPTLRVRAIKWVTADTNRELAPEGWRALMWQDLKKHLSATEIPAVPDSVKPAGWRGTVDEIDLQLQKTEIRQLLESRPLIEVMTKLEELAGSPRMSRRLRLLAMPQEVRVLYKGATVRNEQTLQKQGESEYTGTLADLKESIRFTVQAADYYTPYKKITVVPPPTLVELMLEKTEPAYLYHRIPRGGSAADLRGKKQRLQPRPLSLAGETSGIDVPAGTDVLLTARSDKELKFPDGAQVLPGVKGAAAVEVPIEPLDAHAFQMRFKNIAAPKDFVIDFTDTDGVKGRRHIIIRPVEDQSPEVDAQIEVIRKAGPGFMVTPSAMIPFSGKIRDDHGLATVDYAYTLSRVENAPPAGVRAVQAASVVPLASRGTGPGLAALGLWNTIGKPAEEEKKPDQFIPLETFKLLMKEREAEDVAVSALLERLEQPIPEKPLLKEHNLEPDREFFDVEKLNLKSNDDRTSQPRFKMNLSVVAADNNIETGPHIGQSKEKFTVIVVSENELLLEIGKEEATLFNKLEDALNRLKDARVKLDKVSDELPQLKPDEFSPMVRRTEEFEETINKSWDISKEVLADYSRILKELTVNRVQPGMINKVNEKICQPLEGALNLEFVRSDESMKQFKERLEAKAPDTKAADAAKERLDRLIERLQAVLDAMADVTTINKLIETLTKIKQGEEAEKARLKKLLDQKQDELLNKTLEPEKKK